MFYDARGKLTITVDLATTDPARSRFPVCDTTEITTKPGVLVIEEVAPQLMCFLFEVRTSDESVAFCRGWGEPHPR